VSAQPLRSRAIAHLAANDAWTAAERESHEHQARTLALLAISEQETAPTNDGAVLASGVLDTVGGSIGKADSKAAFLTSLDTAVLAGVLAMQPTGLGSVGRVLLGIGAALITIAALLAVAVVLPILRSRQTAGRMAGDFLYSGAVRTHTADELAERLTSADSVKGVCAQAITLSRLSWLKHRVLQVAMLATIGGGLLIASTLLLAGGAR
jgi:hypothetical protein